MRSASEPPPTPPRSAPAHAAMELLGQRWMLRVIWELDATPLGFLELRRRMDNCSSSMLSVRLQRLVEAGIAAKLPDKSYELTTAGKELAQALTPIWEWSERWSGCS